MFGFKRKTKKQPIPPVSSDAGGVAVPRHVGIIMDGNGRWAKKRNLPRTAGHHAGAQVFRKIVKHCEKRGVEVLTFYAFSTENWKRPSDEVGAIMKLFESYLEESLRDFAGENIRTRFIGDPTPLSPKIQRLMNEAETTYSTKSGMIVNLAINYGGREDILQAVRRMAAKSVGGSLLPEDINEDLMSEYLYTHGQPDPDLILRPSGEMRSSNFLLWQSAYAEYVFMDVLWPDFTGDDMDRALDEYARRNRRFGGI